MLERTLQNISIMELYTKVKLATSAGRSHSLKHLNMLSKRRKNTTVTFLKHLNLCPVVCVKKLGSKMSVLFISTKMTKQFHNTKDDRCKDLSKGLIVLSGYFRLSINQ